MGILNMQSTVSPATGEKIANKRYNFDMSAMDMVSLASSDGNTASSTFMYQTSTGNQQQTVGHSLTNIQAGIVTASGTAGYASVA